MKAIFLHFFFVYFWYVFFDVRLKKLLALVPKNYGLWQLCCLKAERWLLFYEDIIKHVIKYSGVLMWQNNNILGVLCEPISSCSLPSLGEIRVLGAVFTRLTACWMFELSTLWYGRTQKNFLSFSEKLCCTVGSLYGKYCAGKLSQCLWMHESGRTWIHIYIRTCSPTHNFINIYIYACKNTYLHGYIIIPYGQASLPQNQIFLRVFRDASHSEKCAKSKERLCGRERTWRAPALQCATTHDASHTGGRHTGAEVVAW